MHYFCQTISHTFACDACGWYTLNRLCVTMSTVDFTVLTYMSHSIIIIIIIIIVKTLKRKVDRATSIFGFQIFSCERFATYRVLHCQTIVSILFYWSVKLTSTTDASSWRHRIDFSYNSSSSPPLLFRLHFLFLFLHFFFLFFLLYPSTDDVYMPLNNMPIHLRV